MPWNYVQLDDGANRVAKEGIQLHARQIHHHRFCSTASRRSMKLFD